MVHWHVSLHPIHSSLAVIAWFGCRYQYRILHQTDSKQPGRHKKKFAQFEADIVRYIPSKNFRRDTGR